MTVLAFRCIWRLPSAAVELEAGLRTIQVQPTPPDLPFPHVSQVWLIERFTHHHRRNPLTAIPQLGVASPDMEMTNPATASPGRICAPGLRTARSDPATITTWDVTRPGMDQPFRRTAARFA